MSEAIEIYNGAKFRVIGDEIWSTQNDMAHAFGVNVPAVSKHISNILQEGELQRYAVVSKMEITASDGKKYQTECYSLDMIIAVGFRVKSSIGTRFRIWANDVLKKYTFQGMNAMRNASKAQLFRMLADCEEEKERLEEKNRNLIGTNRHLNNQVDVYAAGCAMWAPVKSKPKGAFSRRGSWVVRKSRKSDSENLF